jgi:hypothetical protein
MSITLTAPDVRSISTQRDGRLIRFLNAYWLRPENAFWMTLRSDALEYVPFEPPVVDVSCGDGVFSFLHAGGVFDADFDVYGAVANLDHVATEHADIYDCRDDDYHPPVVVQPERRVAAGTDWKRNLLDKAARLDFYDSLVAHDNNQPLPFETGFFRTTYCNAAYWVESIDLFLRELARITARPGRVVLQVKLACLADYTLHAHRDKLGDKWLNIIGRGRHETWPSLADRRTWERRFHAAGLRIEQAIPFVTRTHAHVWDVGLRPIAPMLIRMANALTPQTRRDIKRDWVALFEDLLTPLCNPDFDLFDTPSEPAEITYVLRPT